MSNSQKTSKCQRFSELETGRFRSSFPRALMVTFISCCSLQLAQGAPPSFEGLGVIPGGTTSHCRGLSGDGSTVLGWSANSMFRWTKAGGFQTFAGLPGSTGDLGLAISFDGTVVAGNSWMSGGAKHGFRWTPNDIQDIGILPGQTDTHVYGMSSDGNVIVGESGNSRFNAVCWSQATGLFDLGAGDMAVATAASADGSVIVGTKRDSGFARAYRWTQATGVRALDVLPGGTESDGYSVSADGSVIAGTGYGSFGAQAVRWTPEGIQNLGMIPDGFDSWGTLVSGDGSTVAGNAENIRYETFPMIWNARTGMVVFQNYLQSLGLDLTSWTISEIYGISYDGRTLAGYGIHNGRSEAWIASIGCLADFNNNGDVDFFDYLAFVDAFLLSNPDSDINSDGVIDFFDYLDFVDAFSRGC